MASDSEYVLTVVLQAGSADILDRVTGEVVDRGTVDVGEVQAWKSSFLEWAEVRTNITHDVEELGRV